MFFRGYYLRILSLPNIPTFVVRYYPLNTMEFETDIEYTSSRYMRIALPCLTHLWSLNALARRPRAHHGGRSEDDR